MKKYFQYLFLIPTVIFQSIYCNSVKLPPETIEKYIQPSHTEKLNKNSIINRKKMIDCETGTYIDYNISTRTGLALLSDVIQAEGVSQTINNSSISDDNLCSVKITNYINSSAENTEDPIKNRKEMVEYFAAMASRKCAANLHNAATLAGCLLNIDKMRLAALSLCEYESEDIMKITEPLRNFLLSIKKNEEAY